MELPRHHAARPSGDLGGLASGLPPDPAVQMVELARQLRRRVLASPEVDRYNHGPSSSRRPKARGRGESELKSELKKGRVPHSKFRVFPKFRVGIFAGASVWASAYSCP